MTYIFISSQVIHSLQKSCEYITKQFILFMIMIMHDLLIDTIACWRLLLS